MSHPSAVEPPLDLETLCRRVRAGETFGYVYFWGHTPGSDGALGKECLSQWYPCTFDVGGVVYPSAEHWMMAAKARLFGDGETEARILRSATPADAKALGREVRGFDSARWDQHRFDLVTQGNVAKFGQNPALRAFLLGTADAVLVEASPRDAIWGVGLGAERAAAVGPQGWRGLNLLGFALVRARQQLRVA